MLALMAMPSMAAIKVGAPAPDFTLPSTLGRDAKLSDFSDKIVVLEWTNHQCPFVKKHYDSGNMQALQKKYQDDVVWLSIVSSAPGKQGHISVAKAKEITNSRSALPHAVLIDSDGSVGKLYNATNTPQMVVIKSGKVEYMGAIDSIASADKGDIPKADNYVVAAVDSLKKGQPVAVAASKPYGCSVKY
ncbi:thioredoxin family protein [Marinibactrum halimedae]|uniref:Thioredoxin family protein n=2 Tax=Marinibactrum halimedae TaxID=1444977 RepID=A0AA37WMS2_9GAMM|nr:thioredoxin family protein [Marinibactrum halimedae]